MRIIANLLIGALKVFGVLLIGSAIFTAYDMQVNGDFITVTDYVGGGLGLFIFALGGYFLAKLKLFPKNNVKS